MKIPEYVLACLNRLEEAGFAAYIVGGCVRDNLLGLIPNDYDLCTNALPDQTEAIFSDHKLVLAGKKHGTVGVITEGGVVEITTFRTEGNYTDNRHPEWVEFMPNIEDDLARRDFTVNAMAYSPLRGLADPFGGQEDLKNKVLRAVGNPEQRFREDSLRILRGARFAAKYQLVPEGKTLEAMISLRGLMENLARERVFEELCKLLLSANVDDLLRFAPLIGQVIPELESQIGFDQRNRHHAYDLFSHTAHVTALTPKKLSLRWAGLLHDVGKVPSFFVDEEGHGHFYGHAKISAPMADTILRRLKAPTALREEVVRLCELHMTLIQPEKKIVRRWLGKLGPDLMEKLLTLQEADMLGKGIPEGDELDQFPKLRNLVAEIQADNACFSLKDLAVRGGDLMAMGYTGKEIGTCLNRLLELVIEEKLPNEKEALLNWAKEEKQ